MNAWLTELDRLQDAAQAAFSQPITFRPASGNVYALSGIFQAQHVAVEIHDGAQVSSVSPMLEVKMAAMPEPPKQGDAFDIDGTSYEVADVQVDGLGSAKIKLLVT